MTTRISGRVKSENYCCIHRATLRFNLGLIIAQLFSESLIDESTDITKHLNMKMTPASRFNVRINQVSASRIKCCVTKEKFPFNFFAEFGSFREYFGDRVYVKLRKLFRLRTSYRSISFLALTRMAVDF